MRHISKSIALMFLLALGPARPLHAIEAASPPDSAAVFPSSPNRHTFGRAFLVGGQSEAPGYRAYSYLLFASNQAGNETVIAAYLALDEIGLVQAAGAEPQDLNIVYLPLREAPPAKPSAVWLMAHFDSERARSILASVGAGERQTATLVSYTAPLPGKSPVDPNQLLVEDVSAGSDALVSSLDKQLNPSSPAAAVRGDRRLTGRAFLLAGKPEDLGYGLYSYVLFGESLNAGNHALYRAVLDAFFHIEEVRRFEAENQPRIMLNVIYLPLRDLPSGDADVDWFLNHYDFARAQIILARLMDRPVGPYIVSYSAPLFSAASVEMGRLLVEDLAGVAPDLAFLWFNEFAAQAGRAQYWDKPALRTLMLNLRNQIAVAAEAFEEVRTANSNLSSAFASRIKIQE